jgi:hypothetical protein
MVAGICGREDVNSVGAGARSLAERETSQTSERNVRSIENKGKMKGKSRRDRLYNKLVIDVMQTVFHNDGLRARAKGRLPGLGFLIRHT